MPTHYLVRDATGRITGGAGTDCSGRWTYWLVSEGARRRPALSREAAVLAIGV